MQDLGFLAFTLPQVEILMPTKKPRGQALTREQQRANQALTQRRPSAICSGVHPARAEDREAMLAS